MARIRSLHPTQWTDDGFVQCTPMARLLALGLRNEADDNGIFEANSVKLKMRILPADNCEVESLLAELEATNQIWRYTVEGRAYGLIRNFTKWQKPKKPNAWFPLPQAELVPHPFEFKPLALPTSSEPVPNRFPTGGEIANQKGGREEGSKEKSPSDDSHPESSQRESTPKLAGKREDYPVAFNALWSVFPKRQGSNPKQSALRAWNARIKAGATIEEILAGVQRYAEFVRATGKEGSQFVMQAATFLGPERHYREPWTVNGHPLRQEAQSEAYQRMVEDLRDQGREWAIPYVRPDGTMDHARMVADVPD